MNAAARKKPKSRTSRQSYALGAAAIAALLATTACQSGSHDTADASKSSARPGASATATSSATSTTTSGATASNTATSGAKTSARPSGGSDESEQGGNTGTTTGGDSSSVPLCTLQNLSVSATNYDAKGEPVRHLLLVVTNTGHKKCDIQGAPEVTLGNAKAPAPAKKETDPGEVLTLAPGGKAYAGLFATGGHRDTYDVRSMTLGLGSAGGESEPGKPVGVRMPVASFLADDGQWVTYWAGTEGLAMRPVTQS
ncbi:DUF4232 domain-containing protein [Streptomyces adustus]|uniref:DUF4232 domain-containing protein n=1 Tax=Streptomyces adustus TaxID=1609272 RepID=UPI0035E0DC49